jgi:glycosyltransferase involved in cell wall biosynthesis
MIWSGVLVRKHEASQRVGMLVHGSYLMDGRVRRQAECLASAGFQVHVVSIRKEAPSKHYREPAYEVVNGVHIYRLPLVKKRGSKLRYVFEYGAMTLLGIWKLALLHLRNRLDVVHIHNMPDLLVMAGLFPRFTGSTLVLDVHDPMSELFQANYRLTESSLVIRLLNVEERICYRLAEHLVTVSIPMAESVATKAGVLPGAIKVVHNFPDLHSFPVREDRARWPYSRDGLTFLYSGTVTEHYRLDIAVRALAEVSRSIPNVRLLILGTGNRLQEIFTLGRQLGIADKIEHLKPVRIEAVKEVMANCDVGITTHQSGNFADLYFSTKIVEFMTQGIPVISSRTATISKYIPENSVFYFEPLQVDDLVRQILMMYSNPAIVLDRIRNARVLTSELNWQEEERRFISLYRDLIGSRKF